jgi:hypothetical protein
MKYLMHGAITETGQQLHEPDLESWMAQIGAWYKKHAGSGKLADAGYSLTGRGGPRPCGGRVTDGPFMEAKEILGGYSLLETDTIEEAVEIAKTWRDVNSGWIVIEVWPVIAQQVRPHHGGRLKARVRRVRLPASHRPWVAAP